MNTPELSGSWTYRSFNPTYVTGNLTPQEDAFLWANGTLTLRTAPDPTYLEGTIEWQGGGLDLNGTVVNWGHYESFDIVGTGRPRTDTADWEYRYHGIKTPRWPLGLGAVNQGPTVVGSVIRAKPHNGRDRPAGYVGSFTAVKQPPDWASGLTGSWIYRSFHNNATLVYGTAPPTANGLILQEAVFKLETPTSTTLRGTIELPGGVLDIRRGDLPAREGGEPPRFAFVGTGRSGTQTDGWEYSYDGHLTRNWAKPPDANRVDQRPALVGSVIIRAVPFPAASGGVYPFIAVKQ